MRARTLTTTAAIAALALVAVPAASAKDERIPFDRGDGKRAAQAALDRVGAGKVFRVRLDRDDDPGERYRVDIRRGKWIYEVDVSARFRVTDVERERRRAGDDDGTRDQGSGDDR